MRIDRLDLIAFGPFTDTVLDLSGGSEGLHLIYGPNEAGKSSALRAIQQFFSGIPARSTDDFVHSHKAMRVGARLRDRSGEAFDLVRRKGNASTLLHPDNSAYKDEDALMGRLLAGLNPAEFLRRFVIDHAELVAGGKAVVEGKGDLGHILFAGSGLAGLGAVQKTLGDEADGLFKARGTVPPINANLAQLKATRDRLKADALKSSEWLAHDEALADNRARKAALLPRIEEAVRERNRLSRLDEALTPIARRRVILEELRSLNGVPRLAPQFTFERKEAQSFLKSSETQDASTRRDLAGVIADLATLDVPEPLLDQAEAIEALAVRLGRHQQSERDRERMEAERAGFQAEAEALLRDLGRSGQGDDAPRLTTADRAAVLDLGNERQALRKTRDDAETALKKHAAKHAAADARLAALGPERDPSALVKAVKQALAPGDLEARLGEERQALARDERRAAVDLAALGLWSGPLDAMEALAVPPVETVELFKDGFAAAAGEDQDLARRGDDLDAQARQVEAHLAQLRSSGDIPTEDALAEARGRRDAAWQRLKQGKTWDDSAAAAFEPASAQADGLADRLRREAGRVADLARLLADGDRLAADRAALTDQRGRSRGEGERREAEWSALWSPLGVAAPRSPREMLAWLRKQASLAALARSVRETRDVLRSGESKVAEYGRQLDAASAALGAPAVDPDEPLVDRIERANLLVADVQKENLERKRLAKDREALNQERPGLDDQAAAARADWARWEAGWAEAMGRVGLAADALPAAANAVVGKTDDLYDRLDRARANARAVERLGREAARFADDVRALAVRVAPDLAPEARRNGLTHADRFDPEPVAVELSARLTRARAAREKRDSLADRRAGLEDDTRAARETITRERDRLAALCREAGCDSVDALPAVEERSGRRQKLETDLTGLNERLNALAAGAPLDAFLAEAAQADPDELPVRLAGLNEAIDTLGLEKEERDQAIGREEAVLAMMDGSPRAANAGQDAEDLRARIQTDVEQYARLRLASAVLRAGIERYRKKAQDPVLDRASSLFAGLTLGSFDGLRVDYNDRDEPVLKGVRGGGREALGVEAMSLGTADQLYLALRLATLETFLDRHEPLPLVVDDVLIQFDNARSAATLAALAEMSRRTQVLVFTHHEHLRELAGGSVPAGTLFLHTLPGPRPAGSVL